MDAVNAPGLHGTPVPHLFDDRFGRPGKGNDKGKVEGMVGYMRRNFLAPAPSFESFEALNAYLERRCLERMDARLRGHTESIGHRMERDLEALLPLPPVAYDACEKRAGRVSSLSLVRYRTNDYSVPVAYGHRDVLARGCVDWDQGTSGSSCRCCGCWKASSWKRCIQRSRMPSGWGL